MTDDSLVRLALWIVSSQLEGIVPATEPLPVHRRGKLTLDIHVPLGEELLYRVLHEVSVQWEREVPIDGYWEDTQLPYHGWDYLFLNN